MTAVVGCSVLFDGFGQEEGAPVCYASDDAPVGEDEGTGGASDSVMSRRWELVNAIIED